MDNALVALSNELAAAVERAKRSVVTVHARPRLASSGVHWRQGVIVTAEHNDATMGDDYGVGQRRVIDHACRDTGQAFGLRPQRPDFGAQQAQAHLHQTMIEVGKHDIIPAGS